MRVYYVLFVKAVRLSRRRKNCTYSTKRFHRRVLLWTELSITMPASCLITLGHFNFTFDSLTRVVKLSTSHLMLKNFSESIFARLHEIRRTQDRL
jgi:hypothetical protein